MTKQMKREVFMACLVRVSRGILPIGSFKAVGQDFDIDPKTIAKLWKSTMTQEQVNGYQPNVPIDPSFIVSNLSTTAFDTKFGNAGRKPKVPIDTIHQQMENIDLQARGSIRFVAGQVGLSKTTIIRMKKEKQIKMFTMSLKPKLNDGHRSKRLYHCLSKIDRNTLTGVIGLKFKTFYNEVHVDEKWFYLVRDNARYYLTPNEPTPAPKTVQHKSHITKVMFLCALARPRYNNTTRQWFDGLIGIYPVGEFDMYKRGSRYHARELYTQPAQSPDLNVNDLGFFASLQSMYYKTAPTDALELIDKVETCFNNYHVNKLNHIWLTLQSCMNEIIEEKGDNKYKIPHTNKARLERLNQLPISLAVTQEAHNYDLNLLVD